MLSFRSTALYLQSSRQQKHIIHLFLLILNDLPSIALAGHELTQIKHFTHFRRLILGLILIILIKGFISFARGMGILFNIEEMPDGCLKSLNSGSFPPQTSILSMFASPSPL
jgi:hypothetical protein